MTTATDRLTVTLDLSHPDWVGTDGLSEVSSCLRLLAYADNKGMTHRARVARALADQIDAQIPATADDHIKPEFTDRFAY